MTDADDPEKVFKTQAVAPNIQERLTNLAFSQGAPFIFACVVIYFLYINLVGSIPKHIEAINAGFEAVAKGDREARKLDADKHVETVKAVVDGAKDSQDRLERILTNKIKVVETKVNENIKKLEGMNN